MRLDFVLAWSVFGAACQPPITDSFRRPYIAAYPLEVDLGPVPVGESKEYEIELTIEEPASSHAVVTGLHVHNLDGGAAFLDFDGNVQFPVASDAPFTLQLLYAPKTTGVHRAEITIWIGDARPPELTVRAHGRGVD